MSRWPLEKMRQYNRESRKFFKEHGLCQICGKNVPEPGRVTCSDCLQYNQEYQAMRRATDTPEERDARLEYLRTTGKARYEKRKADGLCTRCGRKVEPGKTMCTECLIHRRKMERERQGTGLRDYENLCTRCRKKPRMEGKKVCADCYPILVEHARHMREVGRPQDISREYVREQWRAIRGVNDSAERRR